MNDLIKNIGRAQPLSLKDRVNYEPGKIVSLTLAAQPNAGITLFAFDATEAPTPPPETLWPISSKAKPESPLTRQAIT